jgi:hypothetical protein
MEGSGRGLLGVLSRDSSVGLSTATKYFSEDSRFPGRDTNQEPPEYKSELLPLEAFWSALKVVKQSSVTLGLKFSQRGT